MPKRKEEPAPLVYVDSDVYIDLLQRNEDTHADTGEPRWVAARAVFDAVKDGRVRLAASALTEAEVCCNGEARRDSEKVRELVRGWFTAPSTAWIDVDRFLAREAAAIAARWHTAVDGKFGSGDALHLAAAVRLGCDYLMSHDKGFPHGQTVDGVRILRPQQVWPESLLDIAAGG